MEIVELRVHGVHNTSPASMLGVDAADVGQVAGDGLTGVYRSRSRQLPYRQLDGTTISVEAYSWGALTSGVQGLFGWVRRALWLLLLPFALANLAYWARLHMADGSPTSRWGARAVRLGALLLTVFVVLTPALLGIDLLAWQCFRGGSPGCSSLPGFLGFFAALDAAQRLAVGSLLPLAVIALLWFLSRQSMIRYEDVTSTLSPGSTGDVLRHPRLWSGKWRTGQLQRIHLSVALAVVVGFSGLHVLRVDNRPHLLILACVLAAGLLAACAIGWLFLIHPDDVDYQEGDPDRVPAWVRQSAPEVLVRGMLILTLTHLVVLFTMPGDLNDSADFWGHNLWFITVFVLLTAVHLSIFTGGRMRSSVALGVVLLVFALGGLAILANSGSLLDSRTAAAIAVGVVVLLWAALVGWHYAQRRTHAAEAWNGAGASVLLAAGVWVTLLFTTGIVTVAANFLNGSDHGVDDLVSRSSNGALEAAEAIPDPDTIAAYIASGDVTANDAVVRVGTDGSVRVASGKLEVESLYQPSRDTRGAAGQVLRSLDSTRVDLASLRLQLPSLALSDSCVRSATSTAHGCSAESPDFIPAGRIPVPGRELAVRAADHPVVLTVTKPPQMPLVLPQVLIWSPVVQLAWLLAVLGVLAGAFVVFRRSAGPIDDLVDADDQIPPKDRGASKQARRTAAFAHRAERILDLIGAVTAGAAIVLVCLCATGRAPWDLLPFTRNVATLSMYVVAGLCIALVYLGSQLRRSEGARKGVGILWDLTTFWPRAAHPLAPPCYAERVVPELRTRAAWVLRDRPPQGGRDNGEAAGGNLLVLSGHSQGSAILTAVVSRMSREDLARVRVITYGSQIRSLYGRVFPRVMGPDVIGYQPTDGPALFGDAFPDAPTTGHQPPAYVPPSASPQLPQDEWAQLPLFQRVFTASGQWANLFRRSDPLGWRVFSDSDVAPDHYVPEVPQRTVGDPGPHVMAHGGYQHTLTYRRQVAGWTGEAVVLDVPGTAALPSLPPD